MPEHGLPQNVILNELETKLQNDLVYASGKILSSMCTSPHRFAKQVYQKYMEKNLGDPSLFPASAELEQETVTMLGSLLSNSSATGSIVSGGTEANIIALWAARNRSKIEQGEVIVPVSAHFSFDKACNLLNLKLINVNLNRNFQMDVKAAKKAITSKTVAIVGVAGTTALGIVDPISELSDLALANDVYLHVDAAFGGFVLPFLGDLGYSHIDFDFKLAGVSSITVDPHKMGLAPVHAGGILFRDSKLTESISMKVPYLSESQQKQFSLLGTRSGASAITVWALLKHLGRLGYQSIVKKCLELTLILANEIQQIADLQLVIKPTMNVIGIKSDTVDVNLVFQELKKRGWGISLFDGYLRIVIMPHTKLENIKNLVADIQEILNFIKSEN
jgi:tyrosine decarboxylase/aspartate 1-decarboxylase